MPANRGTNKGKSAASSKAEGTEKKDIVETTDELKNKEVADAQELKAKEEAEAKAKAEKEAEAKAKAEKEAQEKAEAEAKEKAEKEAKEKAEAEAKAKADEEANEKLKKEIEEQEKLKKEMSKTVVAEKQEKSVKLVKVKFIENHTFNKGVEKIFAKKGDTEEVEPHLANKFVSRKIAYILG